MASTTETYNNQLPADFLLPNGLTIKETQAATAVTVEEIYIKAFANNVPVSYWDNERAPNNLTILAQPDGSEDLAAYDPILREQHIIKQLSPAGTGKWAYLLNDPRYLALTQNTAHIFHHA